MDNGLTTITRAKDETDAFLRECVLAGEIRRLRRENAAYAARIRRDQAARFARYEREIAEEKRRDMRWMTAVRMAALFLAGAGCAALMVALAIMVMGG